MSNIQSSFISWLRRPLWSLDLFLHVVRSIEFPHSCLFNTFIRCFLKIDTSMIGRRPNSRKRTSMNEYKFILKLKLDPKPQKRYLLVRNLFGSQLFFDRIILRRFIYNKYVLPRQSALSYYLFKYNPLRLKYFKCFNMLEFWLFLGQAENIIWYFDDNDLHLIFTRKP